MKSFLKKSVVACSLAFSTSFAGGIEDDLGKMGQAAFEGYAGTPLVTLIGSGMNSGWHSSAKQYSTFGLPFGITIGTINLPFVEISNSLKTFDLEGKIPIRAILGGSSNEEFTKLLPEDLSVKLKGLPTAFGSNTAPKFTYQELIDSDPDSESNKQLAQAITTYNALAPALGETPINLGDSVEIPIAGVENQINDIEDIFPGVPSFPVIGNQINIGVSSIPYVDNAILGLRILPQWNEDGVKFDYFGFSLAHEYSRFIPGLSSLPVPVSTSVEYAYTGLGIGFQDRAQLDISSWILMFTGSVDFKIFGFGAGVYGGFGFEGTNLKVNIASYEITDDKGDAIVLDAKTKETLKTPELNFDIEGDNVARLQLGARVSPGFLDIYYDINYGANTIHNFGIALIGLNGL